MCFAFSNISKARSILSASNKELPIFPPKALIKVKDIPPPIIKLSTAGKIFSIIVILVETLEPPKIAVTGFSPLLILYQLLLSSLAINKPKNLVEGKI
jgi:hypothetical protein